jgi:HAD superfamily hydrolase (TIGR01490 family)
VALAIFDLDNTLLAGDSDYLWGQYLVNQGLVDSGAYEAANTRFYEDYKAGTLDIDAFLKFALKPLAEHSKSELETWRQQFIEALIRPILLPAAAELIQTHAELGDTLMIITATNAFVTRPIADLYGIEHLIATTPELRDDRYTGNYLGTPCFQHGKVTRLQDWLDKSGASLNGSWFYSDSHNDLPLLEMVDHPVAVDPDTTLTDRAQSAGWPILSLRHPEGAKTHLEMVRRLR